MYTDKEELDVLAARVGRGEASAAVRLRQQLEPEMLRIVNRALKVRSTATPLGRHILARARAIAPESLAPTQGSTDPLVGAVARQMCETVVDRLRQRGPGAGHAKETVRD